MKGTQEQGKKTAGVTAASSTQSSTPSTASSTTTTKSTTKQTKMPTPQEMQELYDKITPLQKIVTLQHIYSLYMAAAQQSEKKEVSFNIIQLQRMINSNPLVNPEFDFLDISGFLNNSKEKMGKTSGGGNGSNLNKGPVSPVQLIQILTESLTLRDERGRNEQVIQQVPNTMLFRLSKFIDLNFVKDRLIKLLNAYKNTTLKEIEELENKWKTKKSEIQKIEEGKMDDGVLYEEFLKDLKRKRGTVDKKSTVIEVKKENNAKSSSPIPEKNSTINTSDITQGKKLQISRHVSKQIEKSMELVEKNTAPNSGSVASSKTPVVVNGKSVEKTEPKIAMKEPEKIVENVTKAPEVVEIPDEKIVKEEQKEPAVIKSTPSVVTKKEQVHPKKDEEKEVFVDASESVSPKEKPVDIKKSEPEPVPIHNTRSSKHKLDENDVEEVSRKKAKTEDREEPSPEVEDEDDEVVEVLKPSVEETKEEAFKDSKPIVIEDDDNATVHTRAKTRRMTNNEEKIAQATKAENKKFQQLSIQLITHISSHRIASMFLNPVNAHDEPQYYELIKKPVDLKTLVKRIKSNEIHSLEKLELEMQIMFTNAIMYNDMSQEDVYNGILDMKKEWEGLVSMLKENM